MQTKTLSNCPICNSVHVDKVWELPGLPVTERFATSGSRFTKVEQIAIDQTLSFCGRCSHGYLTNVASAEQLYEPMGYMTASSTSNSSLSALKRFSGFVKQIIEKYTVEATNSNSILIDIGSNDSSLIQLLESEFDRFVGIDPIPKYLVNFAKPLRLYTTLSEQFDFARIEKKGQLRVFVSSHTLEHLESPRDLFRALSNNAESTDLFVFQFPSLDCMIESGRFFQVHNQHLHYFSISSFARLLSEFGFEIIEYEFDRKHYGALKVAFRITGLKVNPRFDNFPTKLTTAQLVTGIQSFRRSCILFDDIASNARQPLTGYGAGLMYPILCYHYRTIRHLNEVIDEDPNKIGRRYLGCQADITAIANLSDFKSVVLCTFPSENAYTQSLSRLFSFRAERGNDFDIYLPFSLI